MHPPLPDDATGIILEEHMFRPFSITDTIWIGHITNLATIDEFRDVAWPVERAVHNLHDNFRSANDLQMQRRARQPAQMCRTARGEMAQEFQESVR